MNIAGEIKKEIQKELRAGATQEELAAKYKVTQSHISRIISGKCSVSFETLERMFPNATINFHGDSVSIHADFNSGNVVGVNRGKVFADCLSAVMDKILECDELSAEEKVKVMKVLKK